MNLIIQSFLWIFFVSVMVKCDDINYDDDYFNQLFKLGVEEGTDESLEQFPDNEEQPIFSQGVWQCGNCSYIKNLQEVYSETNQISDSDKTSVIQVQLVMKGMRCITIVEDHLKDLYVQRVLGACNGNQVLLNVWPRKKEDISFIVNVFGDK